MPDETNRMDLSQINAFLAQTRHAIAAVVRPNGEAQLSPIWFMYEENRLYFSVLEKSAKYQHLRRDPRITFCIDAGHPDARSVTLSGTAEFITEDSSERTDREWRLLRRYFESDEEAHRYEAFIADDGASVLIAVSPERILGWDFN